uniref:Uncharacterized protein n=1 Tax=Anguilla anguilla TaxID=7936 RepID=A0A0E9PBE5_ANGAN
MCTSTGKGCWVAHPVKALLQCVDGPPGEVLNLKYAGGDCGLQPHRLTLSWF